MKPDRRKPIYPMPDVPDIDEDDDDQELEEIIKEVLKARKKKKSYARGETNTLLIDSEYYNRRYLSRIEREWQRCHIFV